VNPEKDIGASMLNCNSNSDVFSLLLVNCLENHRNSEKRETNFAGSVVNYATTFVILA
jgi:hypothetical protein